MLGRKTMPKIIEFKNVDEINEYLEHTPMMHHWEVHIIARMFENPSTHLLTSCLTYILIQD